MTIMRDSYGIIAENEMGSRVYSDTGCFGCCGMNIVSDEFVRESLEFGEFTHVLVEDLANLNVEDNNSDDMSSVAGSYERSKQNQTSRAKVSNPKKVNIERRDILSNLAERDTYRAADKARHSSSRKGINSKCVEGERSRTSKREGTVKKAANLNMEDNNSDDLSSVAESYERSKQNEMSRAKLSNSVKEIEWRNMPSNLPENAAYRDSDKTRHSSSRRVLSSKYYEQGERARTTSKREGTVKQAENRHKFRPSDISHRTKQYPGEGTHRVNNAAVRKVGEIRSSTKQVRDLSTRTSRPDKHSVDRSRKYPRRCEDDKRPLKGLRE